MADTLPPSISNITVSDITDYSVTISWSTDELSTGQIEYGIIGSSNQMLKPEDNLAESHSTILATLEAATSYEFTISAQDSSGNQASTTSSFTTLIPSPDPGPVTLTVGDPAPNFTLPALDGKAISLSDYKGKTVMVHFWSALCHACKAEMPLIQHFYTTSQNDDLVVLALSLVDEPDTVKEFTISNNITLPVLLDPEAKLQIRYNPPPPFPTTYLIDSNGIIRNIKEGRFLNIDEIQEIMKSL